MARQFAIRDALDFIDDRDHFGPLFESFASKRKLLPKTLPAAKTDSFEYTDRMIREQLRMGVPLAEIQITRVTHVPIVQPTVPKPKRKKQALRRAHASPDRAKKAPDTQPERAGETLVEIKLGVSDTELAHFYGRERQRYLQLSRHAATLCGGNQKFKERAQAHAILKGFANGLRHRDAALTAWTELLNLTAEADARQLAHILKVTRELPISLEESFRFRQVAPRAAFLNKHILQPLIDSVLRDGKGAPITDNLQVCYMLRQLPVIAEIAMEQHVHGMPDRDCVTPGDIRSFVENLMTHQSVQHLPFYRATLQGCLKDIQRVPRNVKLRMASKGKIDAAFAESVRLLTNVKQKPATAAKPMLPAALRPRVVPAPSPAA